MRAGGLKLFGISFLLTAAVLAPLILCTLLWVQHREEKADRVAQSQTGVAVQQPTIHHRYTLLVALADDTPAFVLANLDATADRLALAVIPAEGVVLAGQQPVTLAESYKAAGPARVAQLLQSTLGVPIDAYLALTPASLARALGQANHLRTGLTGALPTTRLEALGLDLTPADWTSETSHALMYELQQCMGQNGLTGADVARVRAQLWGAAVRQQLQLLPAALPDGLRQVSGATLTSLTAQDYYTLGETLEFLANRPVQPIAELLPGSWNAAAGRYEFSDDTLAYLQAYFSRSDSSSTLAASSVP